MKGKIKKVNQKDLKFKKIKLLTKCILNPNINSSIIEENKAEFNSIFKYRMFNHVLTLPKIITYINTHMNNLFMFNKYPPRHWIQTFAEILRSNDINKTSQLYYPKHKTSQRDNFFKIIEDYTTNINMERKLNHSELECIYQLYNSKVITNDQFNHFKAIGTGKSASAATSKGIKLSEVAIPKKEEPSDSIEKFVTEFKETISNKLICKRYCKFTGNPNLIIKTNVTNTQPVDLAIISFSPTEEEISSGSILGHHLGIQLDKIIQEKFKDISNFKYLYTHRVLCQADQTLTAAKLKESIKVCKPMNDRIFERFPPKFKLILGTKTKGACGITLAMGNCHNKVLNNNCIIAHSPEECVGSNSKGTKFLESLDLVYKLIKENKEKEVKSVKIPEEQQMDRIEKGWLLWDTQIIDNRFILYTFTHHETMEKKYIKKENVEYPVYIKHGDFKHCDYITSEVDDVVYVNAFEKAELSKQLGWNVRNTIKNV